MSKYIIDTDQFEKLFETKAVAVLGIGDNLAVPEEGEKTVWTRMLNVADLEELTSNYINKHFSDLQDTAYQKGLHDGESKCRSCNEYQRGLEDGKAVHDKGCEGCRFTVMGSDTTICAQCCNAYHNRWTAKDTYYDIIRNSIHNWVTELNVKLEDISKVLEDMKHD